MKKRKDFVWDTGWRLNRFARIVHGFSGRVSMAPDWAGETAQPPVDIVQDDKGLLVELEAPGMSRDDLLISIDGERLTIEGFKSGRQDADCTRYLCLERISVVCSPKNLGTSVIPNSFWFGHQPGRTFVESNHADLQSNGCPEFGNDRY